MYKLARNSLDSGGHSNWALPTKFLYLLTIWSVRSVSLWRWHTVWALPEPLHVLSHKNEEIFLPTVFLFWRRVSGGFWAVSHVTSLCTRWNLPQNHLMGSNWQVTFLVSKTKVYRCFQIQEFQFEANLMHYVSIAPGRLRWFGLVTVKSIGTHWNVTKPGSGLCMDSKYLSPISHFSTPGIHFE
jgi:hypothetical protein